MCDKLSHPQISKVELATPLWQKYHTLPNLCRTTHSGNQLHSSSAYNMTAHLYRIVRTQSEPNCTNSLWLQPAFHYMPNQVHTMCPSEPIESIHWLPSYIHFAADVTQGWVWHTYVTGVALHCRNSQPNCHSSGTHSYSFSLEKGHFDKISYNSHFWQHFLAWLHSWKRAPDSGQRKQFYHHIIRVHRRCYW